MGKVALGSLLFIALVCGSIHTASALRCGSNIISPGDSKWHVQDVCGEPRSVDVHQEVVTKQKYDEQLQAYVDHTIYIDYEIWMYQFGTGRLDYILIFRDHTLMDEITEKQYKDYWIKKNRAAQ